jgi:hypothetical protein
MAEAEELMKQMELMLNSTEEENKRLQVRLSYRYRYRI